MEAVKDRWVFCLQPDPERVRILAINDDSLMRRYPWAQFREKHGGDFQRWKRQQADAAVDPVGEQVTGGPRA